MMGKGGGAANRATRDLSVRGNNYRGDSNTPKRNPADRDHRDTIDGKRDRQVTVYRYEG